MKRVMAFVISAMLMAGNMCICVNADTIGESETNISSSDAVVYSTGLIYKYSVSISQSGNTIYMTGNTDCSDTMKSVGFKNIVLQRSSNGTSWSDYFTIGDILNSSTSKCSVSKKNLGTVPTGYYYRVKCTHYAKETGLFGKSESISNTSNSVKVS